MRLLLTLVAQRFQYLKPRLRFDRLSRRPHLNKAADRLSPSSVCFNVCSSELTGGAPRCFFLSMTRRRLTESESRWDAVYAPLHLLYQYLCPSVFGPSCGLSAHHALHSSACLRLSLYAQPLPCCVYPRFRLWAAPLCAGVLIFLSPLRLLAIRSWTFPPKGGSLLSFSAKSDVWSENDPRG